MVKHYYYDKIEKSNKKDLEKHPERITTRNNFISKVGKFGFYRLSIVVSAILFIFILTGILSPSSNSGYSEFIQGEDLPENTFTQSDGQKMNVVMFSSLSCKCCHLYLDYLNENGFNTIQKNIEDNKDIKDNLMIPENLRTCHTIVVGNYFIEGHVPLSVVFNLLNEMSNIDGLAFPGMPSGSPGMSGQKNSDWVIFSILDGTSTDIFQTL